MKTSLIKLYIFVVGLYGLAFAQTLDDVRKQLSDDLKKGHFASTYSALILLSDELELSGANYTINQGDDDLSDTKLKSIAFPFHKSFSPDDGRTGLYVEGAAGYVKSSNGLNDIFDGEDPEFETQLDADWTTVGGLLGLGADFELGGGVHLVPIVNFGLAYIESEADYAGPGAPLSAAVLDGIAFNWDGWTFTGGTALRVDWVYPFWKSMELQLIGRYDVRWTRTFAIDNSAQEFSDRFQLGTIRMDLTGPTGLYPKGRGIYWRAKIGYRHFVEGDLYGVDDLIALGIGLEYDVSGLLPFGSRLGLNAGIVEGEDLDGYNLGLSLSF